LECVQRRAFPLAPSSSSGFFTGSSPELLKIRRFEKTPGHSEGEVFMWRERVFLLCVAVFVVAETRAYAYTDPGSGALIWQMLVGASIGVMFYLRRIIGWARTWKENRKAKSNAFPSDPENKSGSII